MLAYLIPGALLLGGFMALLGGLSATALAALSSLLGNLVLFGLILLFLLVGWLRQAADIEGMTLMFQQEVAERITAGHGAAHLAVFVAYGMTLFG